MKNLFNNEKVEDFSMYIADVANVTSVIAIGSTILCYLAKKQKSMRTSVVVALGSVVVEKAATMVFNKCWQSHELDDDFFDELDEE